MEGGQVGRVTGGWLLLLFSVFLILQHWQVFPYHDDWGYAVLSYVTEQTGFTGQNFSQWQLLDFLYEEYMSWSPRFLAFFIQINLFKLGLDAVRLVQVAVILGWLVLSIRLVTGRILHPIIAAGVLYFLAWPSFVTIGGLYWFSASIAYLWGVVPLLLGAKWLSQDAVLSWRAVLMLALAALFQEQMALAILGMLAAFVLVRWSAGDKLLVPQLVTRCTPVVVAACMVVLAPGNFARKASSSYDDGSLFGTIIDNLSRLGELVAGSSGGNLAWILMLASVAMLAWRYLCDMALSRGYRISLLSAGILVLLGLAQTLPVLAFLLLWSLWALLLLRLALDSLRDTVVLTILIGAAASLLLLLVAPSVSGRSLLIFYAMMLVPIAHAMYMFSFNTSRQIVLTSLLAGVLPFALSGAMATFQGYAANRPIHRLNDARLRVLSHDIHSGHEVPGRVTLSKLPDDRYAETMPYQRPLIEKWMKKFYGLPQSIQFRWQ